MKTLSAVEDASLINSPLIRRALKLISGKWRLSVLLAISGRQRRFADINLLLPGISKKVLTAELHILVALGAVERTTYHEVPPKISYRLTPKGGQAMPILKRLLEVGQLFT